MNNTLTIRLPKVSNLACSGKKILVRADLEWEGKNSPREQATSEIVAYLQQQGAKRIKVIGHKGDISMVDKLGVDVNWDLRADQREQANDPSLAKELAEDFDIYINEAFAVSHRSHCSIVALPKLMQSLGRQVAAGNRFEKEIQALEKVANLAGTKVAVIGGAKSTDKAKCADQLEKTGWQVLRGGLLPKADLRPDGLDVSDTAITKFTNDLARAGVIVVAGPVGKYEDTDAEKGTREILTAVTQSQAYTVAGGGDTEAALEKFGLTAKFDWISVGGGAMLEFISTHTLAGIEALVA